MTLILQGGSAITRISLHPSSRLIPPFGSLAGYLHLGRVCLLPSIVCSFLYSKSFISLCTLYVDANAPIRFTAVQYFLVTVPLHLANPSQLRLIHVRKLRSRTLKQMHSTVDCVYCMYHHSHSKCTNDRKRDDYRCSALSIVSLHRSSSGILTAEGATVNSNATSEAVVVSLFDRDSLYFNLENLSSTFTYGVGDLSQPAVLGRVPPLDVRPRVEPPHDDRGDDLQRWSMSSSFA